MTSHIRFRYNGSLLKRKQLGRLEIPGKYINLQNERTER